MGNISGHQDITLRDRNVQRDLGFNINMTTNNNL
jgi:hypothetical protein